MAQKTVATIMLGNGRRSRTVRKYKATTYSNHDYPVQENVLTQTFVAERPSEVYMADINYIPTDEGRVYLASLEDLYSRKMVGRSAAGARMTKGLCIKPLERAWERQRPTGSVLHHSDRRSQYASHDDQEKLQEDGMVGSMSRKGNWVDNACIFDAYDPRRSGVSVSSRDLDRLLRICYGSASTYTPLSEPREACKGTVGRASVAVRLVRGRLLARAAPFCREASRPCRHFGGWAGEDARDTERQERGRRRDGRRFDPARAGAHRARGG